MKDGVFRMVGQRTQDHPLQLAALFQAQWFISVCVTNLYAGERTAR